MSPRTPVRIDRCYIQDRICENTQPALAESLGHRHTLLEAQGSRPPPTPPLSFPSILQNVFFPTPASGSFLLAIRKEAWQKGRSERLQKASRVGKIDADGAGGGQLTQEILVLNRPRFPDGKRGRWGL